MRKHLRWCLFGLDASPCVTLNLMQSCSLEGRQSRSVMMHFNKRADCIQYLPCAGWACSFITGSHSICSFKCREVVSVGTQRLCPESPPCVMCLSVPACRSRAGSSSSSKRLAWVTYISVSKAKQQQQITKSHPAPI